MTARHLFRLLLVIVFLSAPVSNARADNNAVYDRITKSNTIKCGYYVWPPLIAKDANTGILSGPAYDMMQEIGRQLSLKIDWAEEVNLGTMFEGYNNGRYDMICAPITATPARARATDFTIPFAYGAYNLYTQFDNKKFDNQFKNIDTKDVRYVSLEGDFGSIIGRELFPQAQKMDLPQLSSSTDVMMSIATKKADVTAIDEVAAIEFMRANPGKIRLIPGGPARLLPYNYSIPVGEEKLKSMLNTTLQVMMDSGYIDQALKTAPDYDKTVRRIAPPYHSKFSEE